MSIQGLAQVQNNITSWSKKAVDVLDRELRRGAISITSDARRYAPYKWGALKASINFRKIGVLSYRVEDGVHYGIHQEFGVKHSWTIKVRDKKVLTDGKDFFGKQVTHPRLKAHPFMRAAFKKNEKLIIRNIKKALRELKP